MKKYGTLKYYQLILVQEGQGKTRRISYSIKIKAARSPV
jgi:hypothetical protein